MKTSWQSVIVFTLLASLVFSGCTRAHEPTDDPITGAESQIPLKPEEMKIPYNKESGAISSILNVVREEYEIKKNSTSFESLREAGFSPQEINEIVKAAKPEYNLSQVTPGTRFTVEKTTTEEIHRVVFNISNIQRLELYPKEDNWVAELKKLTTKTRILSYEGEVQDSLWTSGMKAEVPPYLITELAEVFSWEVDFYREIRPGDRWKFSAEEILAEGKHVGWGNILHAEYINQDNSHKAYYFEDKAKGVRGHFDELGRSLRKMFLKSPLKFGRITSRFSRRRFH